MGFGELLVVLVFVLVVFSLGKGMREFRKGLHEPPDIEKAPERDDPASKPRRE